MVKTKDSVLIQFLDGLYQEIERIEAKYAMTYGQGDLRRPIDAFHDAVREFMLPNSVGAERLSVMRVTEDVDGLRARIAYLRTGAGALFSNHNAEDAKKQKHQLVLESDSIIIPLPVLVEELSSFALTYAPEETMLGYDYDVLELALEKRVAERWKSNRWTPLQGSEFWAHLRYTMNAYYEFFDRVLDVPLLFQAEKFESRSISNYSRERTEDSLKALWVQMCHPINLSLSLQKNIKSGRWEYVAESAIHEEAWRPLEREAHHLADAYARYTVMFVALLAEKVDTEYKDELSNLHEQVRATAELLHQFQEMHEHHHISAEQMQAMMETLLLEEAVHQDMAAGKAAQLTQESMGKTDKAIEALDAAHFSFLTGQLAVYESSQDVVKKLASQGLNIAGKFVATAAAQETQRGRGGKGR